MKNYYYEVEGKNGVYYAMSTQPIENDKYTQITQATYEAVMEKNDREEKERQFKRLMAELYPPEED